VVEIVKDLPGRLVKGLFQDFLLEKLPGYFLHQLDAGGAVRANPLYLLQLFQGGSQDSPQGLEPLDGFFRRLFTVLAGLAQGQQQLHNLIIVEAGQSRLDKLFPQSPAVPFTSIV